MELLYILAGIAALTAASPHLQARQNGGQICNLHAAFCDRKYSNVTLVGTHDAPFVGPITDVLINQEKTVSEQLDAGIRFLTGQTHILNTTTTTNTTKETGDTRRGLFSRQLEKRDAVLHMCHTSCALLDAGTLENYLTTVKTWLDANPNEVVTLLLTNGDYVDVSLFGDVFSRIPGLIEYAFVPSSSPAKLDMDAWPTYGELIGCGTRLVVFMDYHANESAVPYILDEFTYFFETPYDTTDPSFAECAIDRPPNTPSADGRMYIVNHFLDRELVNGSGILIPDNDADYTTNAATGNGSIGAQADLCTAQYGRVPNVVLVDMFDRGDVFTAQDNLNGLELAAWCESVKWLVPFDFFC